MDGRTDRVASIGASTEDLIMGVLSGGLAGNSTVINTILEYDIITNDSYTEIGAMTQARYYHAVSVVKYEDFSNWSSGERSCMTCDLDLILIKIFVCVLKWNTNFPPP